LHLFPATSERQYLQHQHPNRFRALQTLNLKPFQTPSPAGVAPVHPGGLDLSAQDIGVVLICGGVALVVFQLTVFPVIIAHLGATRALRIFSLMFAAAVMVVPLASLPAVVRFKPHYSHQPRWHHTRSTLNLLDSLSLYPVPCTLYPIP
jgi:hypothetical protein